MVKSAIFLVASVFCFAFLAAQPASATVTVTLSLPSTTVPLGATIVIPAYASDSSNSHATFVYQFSQSSDGGATFNVERDFYQYNSFTWTPFYQEGSRILRVIVQSSSGGTATDTQTITVTSRVTGSSPVISTTNNTLVALYSAPHCSPPNQILVRFKAPTDSTWQQTFSEYCDGTHSVNFYVGGMRQDTTYTLQQEIFNGSSQTFGPSLSFTTGSVPSEFSPQPSTIIQAAPASDTVDPFQLHCTNSPYATDLQERVVWYLPTKLGSGYLVRPAPGGTFLGILDGNVPGDQYYFKEFDMAGNPIRETNWTVLAQQLDAYRASHPAQTNHLKSPATVILNFISHEGHRLADGTTLMMVTEELVANQGSGPVDVLGDIILVLDSNFQLKWAWDSFDWLNIMRPALQNNTCKPGQAGCPLYLYNKMPNGQTYTIANDWTHANSIAQDPSDGNLIISLRHQAWVIKVNYANGTGDGHIIWTLGNQGSFALGDGVPSTDWFNYQHDVEFQSNGLLTLFDNNNLQTGSDSRGQAWSLDQTHLVATPVVNVDLGVVSSALGSAQYLPNGNYWFGAGFINFDETQSSEVTPSGTIVFKDQENTTTYRTFRLPSMYDE